MNPSVVSSVPHATAPSAGHNSSNTQSAHGTSHDELVRIFNTALVATHSTGTRDFSNEIYELMENPAFRTILSAVRQFARFQGINERQAAEQIITTFRKMDRVWHDYVFQQGVERLKGQG